MEKETHYVYVVLENCELYPELYETYEEAFDAVITKYKETLEEERADTTDMLPMASVVDGVVENTDTGVTTLYIEKGIYITIHRYKTKMRQ